MKSTKGVKSTKAVKSTRSAKDIQKDKRFDEELGHYLKTWRSWPTNIRGLIFASDKARWETIHNKNLEDIWRAYFQLPIKAQTVLKEWWNGQAAKNDNVYVREAFCEWTWSQGWDEVKRELEKYAKKKGYKGFKMPIPKMKNYEPFTMLPPKMP